MRTKSRSNNWMKKTLKGYRFWLGIVILLPGVIIIPLTYNCAFYSLVIVGIIFIIYSFLTNFLQTLEAKKPTLWPRSTFEAYRFLVYVLIFTSGTILALIRERSDSLIVAAMALALTLITGIFLLDFLGGGIKEDKESQSGNYKTHIIEFDYYNAKIAVYLINLQMASFLVGLSAIAWNMIMN